MEYKKTAIITIFIVGIITAFLGWKASLLGFDYDFEAFFPKDDPQTRIFLKHRDQFVTDNDYVLIALKNEKGIFEEKFLSQVRLLTEDLEQLSWSEYVISPTNLKFSIKDPLFGVINEIPYLHIDKPQKFSSDSVRIYKTPELKGSYFSEDGKSVLIYVRHTPKIGEKGCRTIAKNTNDILKKYEFDEFHIAGRCDAQVYYIDLMQHELIVFVGASILLIIIFLFFSYRSIWGVWVPAVVIITSVVWTLGIMQITGKKIDMILTILPTIMFVIGLSDAIHLISKYLEELRNKKSKIEALKIAYKEVGLATFFTSFTTAIGFLTLLTSSIIPIIDLGTYVAIGVAIAFILTYTLMPAIIYLTKPLKIVAIENEKTLWYRVLHYFFRWVIKNRKIALVTTSLVLVISLFFSSKIIINNYLLEDLKEDNYLQIGFRFIENNFDGCRPYELSIWVKDSSKTVFDSEILKEIEEIEKYLQNHHELGFTISPAAIVKAANRAKHGGNTAFYSFPENEKELKSIVKEIKKYKKNDAISTIVSSDLKRARIAGRTPDVGSYKLEQLDDSLTNFLSQYNNSLGFTITGTAHLIDVNNSYISKNVLQGLLIAFAVIALIVGFMFKSLKLVAFSLLVNILPLAMIGGVMGIFGIDLKMSTAIIFTIAFGIAVDDTIHFLSKLRHELRKGKPVLYAIKRTYLSTGKAIIVTSLILCGGFLTLAFSDFLGTAYIGRLISLTLLFAVLSDLIVLPSLLVVFPIKKNKK